MKSVMRTHYREAIGQWTKELASILEGLVVYCQEPDPKAKGAKDVGEAMKQFTIWPTSDLLHSLQDRVMFLYRSDRKKWPRPLWKAFKRVDKRVRTLRLVRRVDALVKRAKNRLTEAGWSALEELSWEDGREARNFLHDVERLRENLSAARKIDWAQHERVLLRFSPTRSVELACGKTAASREVRCYARALELIVDHDKREPLRRDAEPLVRWLIRIGHPMAKNLEAFDHKTAFEEKAGGSVAEAIKTRIEREGARERDRRYQQRKNSSPEKRRAVTR